MTTTIRPIGAFFVALFLVSLSTPADLFAQSADRSTQGKGGNGKGGGNGGGGGGGDSGDIPLIIAFRDWDFADGDPWTDLLRSDGNAYIDGDTGIDYAHFRDSGQLYLGFTQTKGKNGGSSRHLVVDLHEDPEFQWAGNSTIEALQQGGQQGDGVYSYNAYFQIAVRLTGVRGVTMGFPALATFNIRSERSSELAWGISYGHRAFDGHETLFDEWATVTCVGEGLDPDPEVSGTVCIAWKVEKNDDDLPHRVNGPHLAAVVGGGTRDDPDAGAWRLPFGIAVCRLDAYPDLPLTSKGQWCKDQVGWF